MQYMVLSFTRAKRIDEVIGTKLSCITFGKSNVFVYFCYPMKSLFLRLQKLQLKSKIHFLKITEKIKEPIGFEMELFEKKFQLAMSSKVALLNRITHYIVNRKGKQMRPMFVFLTAKNGFWRNCE